MVGASGLPHVAHAAASLMMAIPVMFVYIFAQRFLVEGLTAGSVKG